MKVVFVTYRSQEISVFERWALLEYMAWQESQSALPIVEDGGESEAARRNSQHNLPDVTKTAFDLSCPAGLSGDWSPHMTQGQHSRGLSGQTTEL